MKNILGIIYPLVLLFPLLTFSGWMAIFFLPVLMLTSFILSIFVVRSYFRDPEWSSKWLLVLIGVYVMASLLASDGGDYQFLGVETLINHFLNLFNSEFRSYNDYVRLVPKTLVSGVGAVGYLLFAIFGILNIAYFIAYHYRPKQLAITEQTQVHHNGVKWIITAGIVVIFVLLAIFFSQFIAF